MPFEREDLLYCWIPSFEDISSLKGKSTNNHLGYMVQLKFYQNNARFPIDLKEIPSEVIKIISHQMNLNSATLESYGFNGRTGKRHRSEILSYLKLRRTSGLDLKRFFAWLRADIFSKKPDDDGYALYASYKWFLKNGLESVASKRLMRLICSERLAYFDEINEMIFASLPQESKQLFDELLSGINTSISFGEIKADSGRIGLESIVLEHKKLEFINRIDLPYG